MTTRATTAIRRARIEVAARSVLEALPALGLSGALVITPEAPPALSLRGVVATAERSDDGVGPDGVARELADAVGEEELRALAVAYVGCAGEGADVTELAHEVAAVARVAGCAVVVEDEAGGHAGAVLVHLAAAGASPRELRLAPSVTAWGEPIEAMRRILCRSHAGRTGADAAPLRVAVSDHQGKSAGIERALRATGAEITPWADAADVVLIDHDVPFHGKLPLVDACVDAGGRAFVYPHGAQASLLAAWDGLYPVCDRLSGQLVTAPGHAEVALAFGYPLPTPVIGWSLCEPAPRRTATAPPRRVLFAPTHPPFFSDGPPARNREIYERLLALPVQLVVRHVGGLEENNLFPAPGVEYVQAALPGAPGMIEQIDSVDAVVGDCGTFSNLAVARGVTTVMWDSAEVWNDERTATATHLDRYRELVRFPWEVPGRGGDLMRILEDAAEDSIRVGAWRDRFIGQPLNGERLIAALRGL